MFCDWIGVYRSLKNESNGLFVVFEHIRQKINEYVYQTLQEACRIKCVDYISMIIYTRIMSIYQRN